MYHLRLKTSSLDITKKKAPSTDNLHKPKKHKDFNDFFCKEKIKTASWDAMGYPTLS